MIDGLRSLENWGLAMNLGKTKFITSNPRFKEVEVINDVARIVSYKYLGI